MNHPSAHETLKLVNVFIYLLVHFFDLQTDSILIDELSIALGGGPDGYRATFKDINASGVDEVSITNVR